MKAVMMAVDQIAGPFAAIAAWRAPTNAPYLPPGARGGMRPGEAKDSMFLDGPEDALRTPPDKYLRRRRRAPISVHCAEQDAYATGPQARQARVDRRFAQRRSSP
jgi:hypothetical protein